MNIVEAVAGLEQPVELHLARLLLLLDTFAQDARNPSIEGLTKLAKLDFLLRYPVMLERALLAKRQSTRAVAVEEQERHSVESAMVRYRFGPWDHRYREFLNILVAKGLVTVSQPPVQAQNHSNDHSMSLPVAVDGAVNPEGISPDVAYRHFLMAVAVTDSPTSDELARQAALLDRIGLSVIDRGAFLSALTGLRGRLDDLSGEAKRLGTGPLEIAGHDSIRAETTHVLDEARARIAERLSPDGRSRFHKHVLEHVRRRIVIYGVLPK